MTAPERTPMEHTDDFTFTWASPGDAELLADLRVEMRRERETRPCPMDEAEFRSRNVTFFRRALADGTFLSCIARAKGEAAACSGLSLEIHPPTYANPGGKIGYVTNMYTRPAWRKRGLAGMLLERLIAEAAHRGCTQIELNAAPMARQLYLARGFRPIDGEMRLELAEPQTPAVS